MEFSIGNVLGKAMEVLTKNFFGFSLLALLLWSPLFVVAFLGASGAFDADQQRLIDNLANVIGGLLQLILAGAVTYGTVQELRGYHVETGDAVSVGLKRVLPVLWVGLLAGLCIMGGFILLIIPGFILLCVLWPVVPIAVVEKQGGLGSLRRSAELTKGRRWTIFGLVLVVGLLNVVVTLVVVFGLALVSLLLAAIAAQVVTMYFNLFGAVCVAVGYSVLRNEKDGVELDELAAVFE